MNQLFFGRPAAVARITGGCQYPDINGTVSFYNLQCGTMVVADICGLPTGDGLCGSRVFAFHIHEGMACTGEDFADTGGHYNPQRCTHPYHAGDLPPLFESCGKAYMAVLTGRFRVSDIMGRTVVIHSEPDDFRTQPSGNSGEKIACGVIRCTAR